METQQRTQILLIVRLLPWIEKLAVIMLLISAVMMILDLPFTEFVMISLSTLAIVFFLNAQLLPPMERTDEAPLGFNELLTFVILPKVLWISASVSTIGILFQFLGLDGFEQMLLIGGSSLSVALLLLLIQVMINGVGSLKLFQAVLMRVVPILVIALYLLLNS